MKLLSFVLGAALSAAQLPDLPVEQYQLSNGLTVLLSEDHQIPVVSTEIVYLVGSSYERKGRTGFAHLFEHLMFQGSKNFNNEYFTPFEPIGAQINGTTSRDRTNYYETVPSNYLELSFWMESDRMENLLPVLTQEKLDNQRDVVKNERRQSYENRPYGMAWIYLGQLLYPEGHPYRHAPIGSHEDLTAATLNDVRGFFQQYYVPSNAALVVVGDFQRAATKDLIQTYFGSIPSGSRAPVPKASVPTLDEVQHLTKTDNVKLPRIYLAWHSPALFDAGDAELDLMSSVLTTGKTSRLYQPLVYEKKVATSVDAYQVSERLSSFFVVEATAAPGVSLEKLEKELMAALTKALSAPPTDDELERAKNGYKKGFYERIESVSSRASLLGTYYLHTGRGDYFEEDFQRYASATKQGVQDAAKRWLDLDAYVRLDIVPGQKQPPAAKATTNSAKVGNKGAAQ